MNWGKWIIVAFILFAAFIATLVSVCVRQDVSLVSGDYYQQEIAYQQHIERLKNTASLAVKPEISYAQGLTIAYNGLPAINNGKIKLFCPANAANDKTLEVPTTPSNQETLSVVLPTGMYHAQFSWTEGGKDYFIEQIITL